MESSQSEWLKRFKAKDYRALGRFISWAENRDVQLLPILEKLFDPQWSTQVLGITGPPGAGKSTLTSQLVKLSREKKKTASVVAVDPMSPFTGGALLGDRIRMLDHFNDPGVFIRSLSTRGKLGGLSLAAHQVIHLIKAFEFDWLFLETVGVGQSEVDIRKVADVTMVVLVPEAGDGIQALKAGISEIGDIFVVNKADRPGADKLVAEIKSTLELSGRSATPVLATHHNDRNSIAQLYTTLQNFWQREEESIRLRRAAFDRQTSLEWIEMLVREKLLMWLANQSTGGKNPYRAVQDFIKSKNGEALFPEKS